MRIDINESKIDLVEPLLLSGKITLREALEMMRVDTTPPLETLVFGPVRTQMDEPPHRGNPMNEFNRIKHY